MHVEVLARKPCYMGQFLQYNSEYSSMLYIYKYAVLRRLELSSSAEIFHTTSFNPCSAINSMEAALIATVAFFPRAYTDRKVYILLSFS